MSVAIRLADDVDLGRGGMIVGIDDGPTERREVDALVCWLGEAPIRPGGRYWLQHTTRTVRALVDEVVERIDVTTLDRQPGAILGANDIGRIRLRLAEPIFADAYRAVRSTGAAILIDEATNATVGALIDHRSGGSLARLRSSTAGRGRHAIPGRHPTTAHQPTAAPTVRSVPSRLAA